MLENRRSRQKGVKEKEKKPVQAKQTHSCLVKENIVRFMGVVFMLQGCGPCHVAISTVFVRFLRREVEKSIFF